MNLRFLSSGTRLVTLVAVSSCVAAIHAATMPTAPQTTAAGDQENQYQYVRRGAESEKLREAYQILAWADHDYKGHRAKAMKSIESASKLIGMDLKGEGKGHERQGVSDAQVRHARELLMETSDIVAGQPRVHKHVEAAIKELSVALDIK